MAQPFQKWAIVAVSFLFAVPLGLVILMVKWKDDASLSAWQKKVFPVSFSFLPFPPSSQVRVVLCVGLRPERRWWISVSLVIFFSTKEVSSLLKLSNSTADSSSLLHS